MTDTVLSSRRNLLMLGAAAVGGASIGGLPGCTTGTTPAGLTQQVIDAIQAAVGQACSFIPNVATLLALLQLFPGIGSTAAIAANVLAEVTAFLCASYKAAGAHEAALAGHEIKGTQGAVVVPIHGLVYDPKTGRFVTF